MKRTRLHSLGPESALKRIGTAKSNKPFMAALLDRAHPGHKDALANWTRLHEVAFEKSTALISGPSRKGMETAGDLSADLFATAGSAARHTTSRESGGLAETRAIERGLTRRAATVGHDPDSRRNGRLRGGVKAWRNAGAEEFGRAVYPDPERPLDIDRSVISPFLRRQDESEPDWLRRLIVTAHGPGVSMERLAIIREAILQEIGFYDLDSEPANDDGAMRESEWRVLAALQNVPVDGWESALSFGDEARSEFEQRGVLSMLEVLGPDGNIYQRLSNPGENPVGDALTTVDQRIRMMQLADPDLDVLSILPAIALARPGREGGTPARSPLATTVAPRVHQFLRSRREIATAGLGTGAALVAGVITREQRAGANMEAAPDLPPLPSFEPPERPDTARESMPADLPPIPPLPGFMPEDYTNLVEIFPDQQGDLPIIDILDNRWGSLDTQLFNTETMRQVRDLADAMGVGLRHIGGGQPDDESIYRKELWLRAADGRVVGSSYLDVAFESEQTERQLLINTVDTRADNVTLTGREERAAIRILRNSRTGDILVTLAKPPRGQTYDLERFLEWIRPLIEEIDRNLQEGSESHERRFDFR